MCAFRYFLKLKGTHPSNMFSFAFCKEQRVYKPNKYELVRARILLNPYLNSACNNYHSSYNLISVPGTLLEEDTKRPTEWYKTMWANSSGTEVAYGRAMLEVLTLQGFATRELKSDM